MFLYYKYVQLRAKHGQLFRYVLLFKVLRGVFFLIVIRILLHTNIIKGVASAKYPFAFSSFLRCWVLGAVCSELHAVWDLVWFGIGQRSFMTSQFFFLFLN